MSGKNRNPSDDAADREIVLTRLFDAPRALVFATWTDPRHIGHWWGPRGFRTTTHEMDVRVGGVWRFTMHGPDGTDFPNKIVYREVAQPERLVYVHGDEDGSFGPPFEVTVTFAEEAGQTRVTMRTIFASPDERAKVMRFGAVEGGKQTLERLGEQLANAGATINPFVIAREFDAPRTLVFKVWTEREHLAKWWGPKDVTLTTCTNDPRPGGRMHYCMRLPDGTEMWGRWTYRDIIPPERLVFVDSFSDPQGGITRHPLAPGWPAELLTTVTFSERAGRTIVTVHWVPINATAAENAAFDQGRNSMQEGWSGTFAQLAAYLASATASAAAPA